MELFLQSFIITIINCYNLAFLQKIKKEKGKNIQESSIM